ncbi:MAG: FAD:protein FMN transferase, partial [Pseudomonadales bacterium]|nr:FAD:protein FMN transferase [Pseudomonadales bacterium]
MQLHTFSFTAMGTPCSLQLYAPDHAVAGRVARLVTSEIARLESKFSRYRADSLLSKINRIAEHGGSLRVDKETAGIIDYAIACFEQSEGLFDITSGILRRAWNFKSAQLPDQALVTELRSRIGLEKVEWDGTTLGFPLAGMELDLGGVVKEFAVDRAAAVCREQNTKHALVNLGGDINVVGCHFQGEPWQVAVSDPEQPSSPFYSLNVFKGALASSGDYARCVTINGRRYGHVLNPRTGWPVSCLSAVSVLSDFCVVAGSASTIAMLKEQDGKTWLRELGLPHVWMDTQGNRGGSLLDTP